MEGLVRIMCNYPVFPNTIDKINSTPNTTVSQNETFVFHDQFISVHPLRQDFRSLGYECFASRYVSSFTPSEKRK